MNKRSYLLLFTLMLPFIAMAKVQLSDAQIQRIGERIWMNEGAGKVEYLTTWNKGENFPSFGIGHFIWYPAQVNALFVESFPALRDYLQQHIKLPQWLAMAADSPWQSREHFYKQFDGLQMRELRQLLKNNVPLQVDFIFQRMEQALPKMLATLSDAALRQRVEAQFYRIAAEPNGPYALIDYINFKGEGVALSERYLNQGWGLLQVLQKMAVSTQDVMAEFSQSANAVLTQRVANAPRDESRWLEGWRQRIQTYSNF